MKAFLFSLIVLFSGSLFAHEGHDHGSMTHLTFMGGKVHAHVTWTQGPRVGEESVMHVEWKDGATHTPIDVPAFSVSLFMPSMGHGSAPTQVQRVLGSDGKPLAGVYDVRNVYFLMGGDWDVNVVLAFPGGARETQKFNVHFDEENDGGHHH